ncbi:MAG: hypothetical protein PHQ74_10060 [Crocinitomicaceae bacterium]|nr:hypothetical protein [Crocinitomicaceae bacterium]
MRILYVFLGIKNKFILLNVILFVNILSVKAQSNQLPGQIEIIESFNGFQYHLVNQVWKVKNPNTNQFYVVTTDKISVKYKSSATSAQIVNVENALNLTRTEKLKIGWYHYEIALNQESIIDFARNLSLNTLILAVDIPSYHQPTGQLSNDPVSTSSWYFDKINMYDAWK